MGYNFAPPSSRRRFVLLDMINAHFFHAFVFLNLFSIVAALDLEIIRAKIHSLGFRLNGRPSRVWHSRFLYVAS